MTPANAIVALDRQIASHGQDIAFQRGSTEQQARGFVRGYKVEQLIGLITQADREVVVSPSSLGAYLPRINDEFISMGVMGKVTAAEPIHMAGVLVRWNLRVRLT